MDVHLLDNLRLIIINFFKKCCLTKVKPINVTHTHTHLLSVEVGHLVVASLCEQDGEHGVRAAARLVHVGSSHRPGDRFILFYLFV